MPTTDLLEILSAPDVPGPSEKNGTSMRSFYLDPRFSEKGEERNVNILCARIGEYRSPVLICFDRLATIYVVPMEKLLPSVDPESIIYAVSFLSSLY